MLERSLAAGVCAVVGRFDGGEVPLDFYRRLGADLAGAEIRVVGDLHGVGLEAFLAAGRLRWLKISEDDLTADRGSNTATARRPRLDGRP